MQSNSKIQQPFFHLPQVVLYVLLVSLFFIQKVVSDCRISHYPKSTLTGSLRAQLTDTFNNEPVVYYYPLLNDMSKLYSVQTMVGVYGMKLDKTSSQLSFKIIPQFSRQEEVRIKFKVLASTSNMRDRWHYIQFSFIVSDSPDLIVGSRVVSSVIPTADQTKFRISEYVSIGEKKLSYETKQKIFISGLVAVEKISLNATQIAKIDETIKKIQSLKSFSWNIQLIKRFTKMLSTQKNPSLSLSQPTFSSSFFLNFQMTSVQLTVKQLIVSYIIFVDQNIQPIYRTVSGSFFAQDSLLYKYNKLPNDDMTILGINGISYPLSQSFSFTILKNSVDQKQLQGLFEYNSDNPQLSVNINFFGIEIMPQFLCLSCPDSPIVFQGFCVSKCPFAYATNIDSEGFYFCSKCNFQNFEISSKNGTRCLCANGHYLVSPTQRCQVCPYDCYTCNGIHCLSCDSQAGPLTWRVLNRMTNRCQCSRFNSNGNALFDDEKGQHKICLQCDIRCKSCSGPLIHECKQCKPNRTLLNGICKCLENYIQNSRKQCICERPFTLNQQGKCVHNSTSCRQNEVLVSTGFGARSCQCLKGFTRNMLSNICTKQCQSYEDYDYRTEKCECKKGSVRDPTSGICIVCGLKLNQYYNENSKKCECIQSSQLNKAGECVTCPPKSYFDNEEDRCKCIYNYYSEYRNGPCMKCTEYIGNKSCKVQIPSI